MADISATPVVSDGSDGSVAVPATTPATSVNPVPWSRRLGHDLGQIRTDAGAILVIGGQRPVDASGRLLHEGDMAAQLALALDNVSAVLEAAGLELTDLAHLRIHTTAIDALLDVQFVVDEHLAEVGATPPLTLIEVSRLAIAGMGVEIDGLAIRNATTRRNP